MTLQTNELDIATKVMVIRHGEKPAAPGEGVSSFGLLENGQHSIYGLTVQGWQRAGALAILFGGEGASFRSKHLVTPDIIFASATGLHSWSLRMQQTITPLRRKLGSAVALNLDFKKGEEQAMTSAALRSKRNVLICWSHEGIPTIAANILGAASAAPRAWPESRYDLVWVFDRRSRSKEWTLRQVPQCLLWGDCSDV